MILKSIEGSNVNGGKVWTLGVCTQLSISIYNIQECMQNDQFNPSNLEFNKIVNLSSRTLRYYIM